MSCLNLRIWNARLWLVTKEVIRRLALPITKRLIDQELQTVIIRITYGVLTIRRLDIHRRNVGNFIDKPTTSSKEWGYHGGQKRDNW